LASKALLLARLTLAFDAQVDRDVEPADGVAVDRDDVSTSCWMPVRKVRQRVWRIVPPGAENEKG
jgi:hypothetical protein